MKAKILDSKTVEISFSYDPELVSSVKELPGRKWNGSKKVWTSPITLPLLDFLDDNDADYPAELLEKVSVQEGQRKKRPKSDKKVKPHDEEFIKTTQLSEAHESDIEVENLPYPLKEFQKVGVAFLTYKKRALLGDEMGLGKTVQSLASIHHLEGLPVLIVCPAVLRINWKEEAEKWLPGRDIGISTTSFNPHQVTITSYQGMVKHFKEIKNFGFKAIIFDESHYLKNGKAKRTKTAFKVAKDKEIVFLLSGTPVLSRPIELSEQLNILGYLDSHFDGFWKFARRYCKAFKDRFGWDFSGSSNLDELHENLKGTCYIRRLKKDVLKELPPKVRTVIPLSIKNKREYGMAEKDYSKWLKEKNNTIKRIHSSAKGDELGKEDKEAIERLRNERLAKIGALKKLAAEGKMKEAVEWVQNFLDSGEKLVLFAFHLDIIGALRDHFKCPIIIGEMNDDQRQDAIQSFKKDQNLIVINIRAGGVGLNLTEASNVAFLEQDWTPAAHDQAEDRCHRMGQESSVNCWYLLCEETIDLQIYNLIQSKRSVVDSVTDSVVGAPEVNLMDEIERHFKK